jgi:hypothetical protein
MDLFCEINSVIMRCCLMDEKIKKELQEKLDDLIDEYGIDNVLSLLYPFIAEKVMSLIKIV